MVSIGNKASALVYRGNFNKKTNQGSWTFCGTERDHIDDNFYIDPPFNIDYMCKLANIRIKNFIDTYGS